MRISVVTPSYNQASYIEQAMTSVLSQGFGDLQYVVMDGGSNDGSVEIIKRYADQLTHWESGADQGQYDAISRGFAKTDGEIMGWVNADDGYFPWTLRTVEQIFSQFPDVEWITSLFPCNWSSEGAVYHVVPKPGYSSTWFWQGEYMRHAANPKGAYIQQESTFWRRRLWDRVGAGFDAELSLAADFDLWARFFKESDLYGVGAMLGGFRRHGVQRSRDQETAYQNEVQTAFAKHGGEVAPLFLRVLRKLHVGQIWPFCMMPSLGLVQMVPTIRWSVASQEWTLQNSKAVL